MEPLAASRWMRRTPFSSLRRCSGARWPSGAARRVTRGTLVFGVKCKPATVRLLGNADAGGVPCYLPAARRAFAVLQNQLPVRSALNVGTNEGQSCSCCEGHKFIV